MKMYYQYFMMQLRCQMQYKISFLLTIIGQFLTAFTSYYGIRFIFTSISKVEDYSYSEVLLCFSVITMAFSIGEMFGGGLASFPAIIRDGRFDRILVRPRSLILQIAAPSTDFTRIGLIIQAVIVLVYAIARSSIEWNLLKIITLILMIGCGSVVFFCLFLIYATISIFTIEGVDFFHVFTYGAREFGKYPFSIYGKQILRFLTFIIPLALIQYYPLLFLTDRSTNGILAMVPLLSLLFCIPSYLFFRFGLRKYKSCGS